MILVDVLEVAEGVKHPQTSSVGASGAGCVSVLESVLDSRQVSLAEVCGPSFLVEVVPRLARSPTTKPIPGWAWFRSKRG